MMFYFSESSYVISPVLRYGGISCIRSLCLIDHRAQLAAKFLYTLNKSPSWQPVPQYSFLHSLGKGGALQSEYYTFYGYYGHIYLFPALQIFTCSSGNPVPLLKVSHSH